MRSSFIFTLSVVTTIACNPVLRGGTFHRGHRGGGGQLLHG